MAAFEWALGLAFDSADAPVLDADAVARVPAQDWPEMRFRLHPSAQRLELRSDAPQVWRRLQRRGTMAPARLRRAPVAWLVWRKGWEPFYREMDEHEAWAIGALGRGRSFAAICNGLRRFAGDAGAAQRGAQLLRNWISEELIRAPGPLP